MVKQQRQSYLKDGIYEFLIHVKLIEQIFNVEQVADGIDSIEAEGRVSESDAIRARESVFRSLARQRQQVGLLLRLRQGEIGVVWKFLA